MTLTLSPDARARLDQHLDAVEAALTAAGNTRDQRRAIADDLESQILDMLAARTPTPTRADLDAILAQLDPPSAYAGGPASVRPAASSGTSLPAPQPLPVSTAKPATGPRYSRTAIWGCVCVLTSFLPPMVVLPFVLLLGFSTQRVVPTAPQHAAVFVIRQQPSSASPTPAAAGSPAVPQSPRIVQRTLPATASQPAIRPQAFPRASLASFLACPGLLLAPLALLGTLLGWIAFFQIRQSHGQLRGTGLALFDGLLWPALLLAALTLLWL